MRLKSLLIVPLLVASLQAASVDNLTFILINGDTEYRVSDCSESASGSLVIPSTYNGLPVTSISSNAFYICSSLTSITIPDSVTSIGDYAFGGCTGLTSITIPDGVTSIGKNAFRNCSGLTSITIPDSVTSIGISTFKACSRLSSITIGNSVTRIGEKAFEGCAFTSIIIPSTVNTIESEAFRDCSRLSRVTFLGDAPSFAGYGHFSCIYEIIIYFHEDATGFYPMPWGPHSTGGYSGCHLPAITLDFIDIDDDEDGIGDRWENTYFGNLDQYGDSDFDSDGYTNAQEYISDSDPTDEYSNQFYDLFTFTLSEDGETYSITAFNVLPNRFTNGQPFEIPNNLDIPSTFNSLPVTSIGHSAFSGYSSLSSITIPGGVTTIGNSAFSGCTGLTSVTIPGGVTTIDNSTFSGCTGLTSVTIPDGVTTIGDSAFSGCTSLISVTIPDGVTTIGTYAFQGCTSLTNVNIPNGVTTINYRTFNDCHSLTSVIIPNSVTNIHNNAFKSCLSLIDIFIPDSVTYLAPYVFLNSTSLTSVIFDGNAPTSLESYTSFSNATVYFWEDAEGFTSPSWYGNSSQTIEYDSDNDELYDRWEYINFGYLEQQADSDFDSDGFTNLQEFVSDTDPKDEYSNEFFNFFNFSLNSDAQSYTLIGVDPLISGELILPSQYRGLPVTSISTSAFSGCSSLTSVSIQDSVTSIGSEAFEHCYNLSNLTIPDSVISIGNAAFKYCYNMSELRIGSGLESDIGDVINYIGTNTKIIFYGKLNKLVNVKNRNDLNLSHSSSSLYTNQSLKTLFGEIHITDDDITSIPDYEFQGYSSITIVTIPIGLKTINSYAFQDCTNLTSITIPVGVSTINSYAFQGCSSLISIYIPDTVTTIGNNAFQGCTNLTSVTIPFGVTAINSYAFQGCTSLTSVTIPFGVTAINSYAFQGCTSLSSVTIPFGVTAINSYAFQGCTSLSSITTPDSVTFIGRGAFRDCSSLENVVLNENLVSIKYDAFRSCVVLETITIPSTVRDVGHDAFNNCTELREIIFEGPPPAISIYDLDQYVVSPTIYYKVYPLSWMAFQRPYALPLVYLGPPTIQVQPQDAIASIGDSIMLSVEATDVRETALSYQWMCNGIEIAGKTAANLSIVSLAQSDVGNYQVKVTNAEGTTVTEGASVTIADGGISNGLYTQQQYDAALTSGFNLGVQSVGGSSDSGGSSGTPAATSAILDVYYSTDLTTWDLMESIEVENPPAGQMFMKTELTPPSE